MSTFQQHQPHKCLLPASCTALTDDDGCNPVVEAELPALLSLIIAKTLSAVGTLSGPPL